MEDFSSAEDYLEEITFQPGDYLFIEGDETTFFYLIHSGQVEIFITDENEAKIPLAIISEGEAIGEFAMVLNEPRSATAQALTKVEVIRVSTEGYQKLFKSLPPWAGAIIKGLAQRLKEADEIIRKFKIVDDSIEEKVESFRRR